jgi:hypothetical protein
MLKAHSKTVRYLKVYGMIVLTYFVLVMAVNWIVDPYNELKRNTIGIYFSVERQAKSEILNYPHDAVIIGTSKIGSISPKALNCYTFYNSSFDAALPEEIYFYLKRFLRNERLVVIALDFEMFNERQWPVLKITEWPNQSFGKLEYLFNFKTFQSSLIALNKWFKQEIPIVAANGQRLVRSMENTPIDLTADTVTKNGIVPAKHRFEEVLEMLRENHFRRFLVSKERLEYLRKLKILLEEKKIPYVVFINPYNHWVLDIIKDLGEEEIFAQWKRDVKDIFPDMHDFSVGEYTFNDDYWGERDAYHFNPFIGAKIINSIIPCGKE